MPKDSSTLVYSVRISSNKKNGVEYSYTPDLEHKSECNYADGMKSGFYMEYLYEDGIKPKFYSKNLSDYKGYYLAFFCNYYMGKPIGQGYFYNPNGTLRRIEFYNKKGKISKEKTFK